MLVIRQFMMQKMATAQPRSFILGALAFWGINTIDAYIDAKFIHSYTLDNNFRCG